MPVFIDQTGRPVSLLSSPQRIISLVPSQTELLSDLGLDKEVVGITKFCVHPDEWFRKKTRVGGTKQINPEIIHQLQPELIIANLFRFDSFEMLRFSENEKKDVDVKALFS